MWDYIGHLCHKLFICFPYRDPVELETSSINVHYSFNYDLLISLHSDCRIQIFIGVGEIFCEKIHFWKTKKTKKYNLKDF